MDIFFYDKKTYISHLAPDFMWHELDKMATTRWYKLSRGNLSVSINTDDSFSIKNKVVFLSYFWPGSWLGPFVLLNGKIEEENNQTIITTVARPNYLASVAFFLFIFMAIVFVINGSKTKDDDTPAWIIMLIMVVLFASAMFFSVRSLRKRFEKRFNLG
ncbi:MAG TPA: hypothetical protein VHM26_10180 [Chitinophagaceae bacterium]|jgi:hypothetical protein|nr:hypothetical protein [Chitinophagaceae bacterium]